MDGNGFNMHLDGLCVACLSTGRRLELLPSASRRFFQEIVEEAVGESCSDCVSVCWECAGAVRAALRLRHRLSAAAVALLQHKKYQYEIGLQTPNNEFLSNRKNLECLQSLSRLSCHINTTVLFMTHTEQIGTETQDVDSGSPIIKLENKDDEMDDVEAFYVEDLGDPTIHSADDNILKAVLKSDMFKHDILKINQSTGKKKKVRRKVYTEEFDESDDEPLTLKKLKQENRRARGKRKKEDAVDGEGSLPVPVPGSRRERRGYREQPAGVVADQRVRARLQRLNVPPGALEMLVLTWEEVERERVRMLSLEQYTRHEHRCEQCAIGFNQSTKLQEHMRKHDPSSGALECSACHIRCREPHALAAHRRRHRVRWRCTVCGSLWSRAAVAADHAARAHSAPAPTHTCPTCGHTAPTLGKLRTHLKEHGVRARCDVCGKSLRDRASLKSHLQIHLGVKEHVCPEPGCGKRFVFKKAMQLHAATHQQHQHLYCHQCDMTFKNQITFYHHMKYNLKHAHPDTFKHACGSCGRRFSAPQRLAEHRAAAHLHTTPARCAAPGCDFACASRPGLRAHVRRVHRGQRARRDHVCHTCGKAYTTKKTLEGHLRSHSGERPFRCSACGASFGYHAALYNHTRLVHLKHKPKLNRDSTTTIQVSVTAQPPSCPPAQSPPHLPAQPPGRCDADAHTHAPAWTPLLVAPATSAAPATLSASVTPDTNIML